MDFIAGNMQKLRAASEYNLSIERTSCLALEWGMAFGGGKFCRISAATRKFFPAAFADN
jgi:hypothetical protein